MLLKVAGIDVVPAFNAGAGINGELVRGEDPVPFPLLAGIGHFPFKSIGQLDTGGIILTVSFEKPAELSICTFKSGRMDSGRVVSRSLSPLPARMTIRIRSKSIFWILSWTHSPQSQSATIENLGHQSVNAFRDIGEQAIDLISGQHHRQPAFPAGAGPYH